MPGISPVVSAIQCSKCRRGPQVNCSQGRSGRDDGLCSTSLCKCFYFSFFCESTHLFIYLHTLFFKSEEKDFIFKKGEPGPPSRSLSTSPARPPGHLPGSAPAAVPGAARSCVSVAFSGFSALRRLLHALPGACSCQAPLLLPQGTRGGCRGDTHVTRVRPVCGSSQRARRRPCSRPEGQVLLCLGSRGWESEQLQGEVAGRGPPASQVRAPGRPSGDQADAASVHFRWRVVEPQRIPTVGLTVQRQGPSEAPGTLGPRVPSRQQRPKPSQVRPGTGWHSDRGL